MWVWLFYRCAVVGVRAVLLMLLYLFQRCCINLSLLSGSRAFDMVLYCDQSYSNETSLLSRECIPRHSNNNFCSFRRFLPIEWHPDVSDSGVAWTDVLHRWRCAVRTVRSVWYNVWGQSYRWLVYERENGARIYFHTYESKLYLVVEVWHSMK